MGLLRFVAAAILIAPVAAMAQTPARVRGTVLSLSNGTMVVHEAEGIDTTVKLTPRTAIRGDTKADVSAIMPGNMLTIVSRGYGEKQRAIGIRIVRDGALPRTGTSSWDFLPGSLLTNGVVESPPATGAQPELAIKAEDKQVTMAIAADATITMVGPGNRAMLTQGAHVVVFGPWEGGPDVTATVVIVGKDGITPPI